MDLDFEKKKNINNKREKYDSEMFKRLSASFNPQIANLCDFCLPYTTT